jgi:hypothetical protein
MFCSYKLQGAYHKRLKTFKSEYVNLAYFVSKGVNIFPIKNGNRLLSQPIFCMDRYRYVCSLEKYFIKLTETIEL